MRVSVCFVSSVLACSLAASADVVEFHDRAEWEAAVGSFTTIDFILPPSGTPISDQYSDLGVHFGEWIFSHNSGSYQNDGWGIHGAVDGAWVHFDTPQHWVGLDHPGTTNIELYRDGELIHTTGTFGSSGAGFFGGVMSSVAFDEIYIFRHGPNNFVFIDDLHFGAMVPGPGGLALLALAGAFTARRRRA